MQLFSHGKNGSKHGSRARGPNDEDDDDDNDDDDDDERRRAT